MARKNETTDVVATLQVVGVVPGSLKGKYVCITGHLSMVRKEFEAMITEAGGHLTPRVDYITSFLVTNADWNGLADGAKVSSKYTKAKQYRTRIISEAQLIELMSKEPE
jgi:NAD-dependent DNA ligase